MSIQTLHDSGSSYSVLAKYDGGVYAMLPDSVCKGIGDEFTINYTSTSLNISFNAGSEALIGGAFFKITSTEAVTLTANSTIYLCANIDLSNPNGQTGSFAQRTSSNMQTENLNGSGTSRDLLLYIITTSATGVIDVQDKRVIKGNETSVSGIGITLATNDLRFGDGTNNFNFKVLTEAQYQALTTKDNNTLYFTYGG